MHWTPVLRGFPLYDAKYFDDLMRVNCMARLQLIGFINQSYETGVTQQEEIRRPESRRLVPIETFQDEISLSPVDKHEVIHP